MERNAVQNASLSPQGTLFHKNVPPKIICIPRGPFLPGHTSHSDCTSEEGGPGSRRTRDEKAQPRRPGITNCRRSLSEVGVRWWLEKSQQQRSVLSRASMT